MARIRTVKPEFLKHYDLYLAERDEGLPIRLAYEGLWMVADREGRFHWRPEQLKVDCLPYDPIDFCRVLEALFSRGFIGKYRVGISEYGYIPTFLEHQRPNAHEAVSKIPSPFSEQAEILKAEQITSAHQERTCMHMQDQTMHVHALPEGNDRRNDRRNGTPQSPQGGNGRVTDAVLFDRFYKAYPRKENPQIARKCFSKLNISESELEGILTWIEKAKVSEQWRDKTKIPFPSTFLNQKRWTGDPPPPPQTQQESIFDRIAREQADGK